MKLNKLIDHTLLKADATSAQIKQLCQEAKDYDFKSVCVNPAFVPQATELLKGSDVEVCTVIGFPLGANTTATKVFEAKDAIANGATEVDMVINISQAKDGQWEAVEEEIKQIAEAVKGKAVLKVIVETALLTDEEIKNATEATVNAGADFVKTSTGFSTRGASLNDVQIMNTVTQGRIGIKASGGVSNRQDALNMVEAGATRIGASKGIQIVSE
ncbi:deoxyribose-phosphate aldolase [Falseniella ignava]|uniref:Deoxyribose-phosphate aldolase n=1 Tax=Falseniella ignava CCUG 37419 TaxID=883112 RepID=K1LY00_9LACT|nr:deoxyribose-phosphate aldolase [Falseniella ignava]EKB56952.1 deoxyribose-phosphate aldolase [Falseniella ignava CCUG 37419]